METKRCAGYDLSRLMLGTVQFGLPYGIVSFAVVAMALGGFYGAGLLEKKFATGAEQQAMRH